MVLMETFSIWKKLKFNTVNTIQIFGSQAIERSIYEYVKDFKSNLANWHLNY